MALSAPSFKHDPRTVSQTLFDLAERHWQWSLLCRVVIFLVGVLVIQFPQLARWAPLIVLLLTVSAEGLSWRTSRLKGIAEEFLRKLDLFDSLGWPLSPSELSDLLTRIPGDLRRRLPTQRVPDDYFASTTGRGPRRALENVQESAWWSKHLAGRMWQLCFGLTLAVGGVSVAVLLVSAQAIPNLNTLSTIGRMVTNTLMFVFSFGLLRLTIDYHTFHRKAERVEQQALALLKERAPKSEQAIQLFNEYHLARAAAPLIPTLLWNRRRTELDELWASYRS